MICAHWGNLTSTVCSKNIYHIFRHRYISTSSVRYSLALFSLSTHKSKVWYLYLGLHWPLESGVRRRRTHILYTSYSSTNRYRQHQSLINLTMQLRNFVTARVRCSAAFLIDVKNVYKLTGIPSYVFTKRHLTDLYNINNKFST